MKKKNTLKRIICLCVCSIMFLALALAVLPSALFAPSSPVVASADESTEPTGVTDEERKKLLQDENEIWEWAPGASLSKKSASDGDFCKNLAFIVYLRDHLLYNSLLNGDHDIMHTLFTVYRYPKSGKPVPVFEYGIYSTVDDTVLTFVYHRTFVTEESAANIDFRGGATLGTYDVVLSRNNLEGSSEIQQFEFFASAFEAMPGCTVDYIGVTNCNDKDVMYSGAKSSSQFDYPFISFEMSPNSINADYYMKVDYSYKDYKKTDFWGRKKYDKLSGTAWSFIRSPYSVLKNMHEKGALEEEYGEYADEALQYLASCEEPVPVRVKYLVEVPETCFARMVTKEIVVPVIDNKIFYDDVIDELCVDVLSFRGSYFKEFEYSEVDMCYVTKYLEGVYLTARTTDGNSTSAGSEAGAKYFLDPNVSYREYYYGMVEKGVYTESVYEFFLNGIKRKYPILAGVDDNDLYGYFGYVVIPKSYSFNTAWTELFNTDASLVGGVTHFSYPDNLKASAYDSLLNEFQYNWLERAWSDTVATVLQEYPATHYIFYADGEQANTGILENGATDVNDDRGAVSKDVQDAASNLLGGLKGFFTGADFLKTISVILGVAGVVALIVGGIFIYIKYFRKKEE